MKLRMSLMSTVLTGIGAAALAQAIPGRAQDFGPTVSRAYPIALSINYTAMIGNAPPGSCGCFLLNGGSSEELFHVWRNVAAVVQLSGNRVGNVPQSQQGLSVVTYMAGPRYSFLPAPRLSVYGQFVAGGVHGFDSYFPRTGPQSTGAADSLAFAPGGGLEIGIKNWFSVRAVEAEYLVTDLPNNVNEHQNNLRISSGVVFRLSSVRLNR
jgi:outer membrane immunogenic protein